MGKYLKAAGITQNTHDGDAIDTKCLTIETTLVHFKQPCAREVGKRSATECASEVG